MCQSVGRSVSPSLPWTALPIHPTRPSFCLLACLRAGPPTSVVVGEVKFTVSLRIPESKSRATGRGMVRAACWVVVMVVMLLCLADPAPDTQNLET